MHGILGDYPCVPYQVAEDVSAIVPAIKIISEIQDRGEGFCTPDFEYANQLLNAADIIYSIGFAMAPANMQRLRFFTPEIVQEKAIKCAVGYIHGRQLQDMYVQMRPFGLGQNQIVATDSNTFFTNFVGLE